MCQFYALEWIVCASVRCVLCKWQAYSKSMGKGFLQRNATDGCRRRCRRKTTHNRTRHITRICMYDGGPPALLLLLINRDVKNTTHCSCLWACGCCCYIGVNLSAIVFRETGKLVQCADAHNGRHEKGGFLFAIPDIQSATITRLCVKGES